MPTSTELYQWIIMFMFGLCIKGLITDIMFLYRRFRKRKTNSHKAIHGHKYESDGCAPPSCVHCPPVYAPLSRGVFMPRNWITVDPNKPIRIEDLK